ncbi:MAG TPA: hypothetical protein VFK41_09950 [Nocardioidaceae bacterium]|nr:hypothetical protein [Nocardioidaceae bacterium]
METPPHRDGAPRQVVILGVLVSLLVVPLVAWGIYAIRWDEAHEGEAMGVGTVFGWSALSFAAILVLLAVGAIGMRRRRPSGAVTAAVLAFGCAVLSGGGVLYAWITG